MQTWWVAVKQADGTEAEPEVARVWFNGTEVDEVLLPGDERGFYADKVRLIERVLPAGCAAAVVAKLQEAIDGSGAWGPWSLTQEAIDILQGENQP
ncbi:hypothetical protein [Methylobacterium fujisawaense]